MKITKRIGLDVGPMCNANCKFCYYAGDHKKRNPSFKKLIHRLRLARSLGMESVDLTGGEPAIREDILELINYAKHLGFKKICMLTNGTLLKNKKFVEKLKDAGLNEVKLSVHSSKPEIHDELMGMKGSFKSLMAGIKNLKETGLEIKINTNITELNYKHLPEIAKFLIKLRPIKVNLKFIIPVNKAKKLDKDVMVKYSEAESYLHKAIDILKAKNYAPSVKFVPFCFMKGYEKYVRNLYQIQYDQEGWNYVVKNRLFKHGWIFLKLNELAGYIIMIKRRCSFKKDFKNRAVIESLLLRFTTKGKSCKRCKYYLICDGLWKGYAKLYGYSELKPVIGEKVKEPYTFMEKA